MFFKCIRHKTEKDFQHFLHGGGFKEEADTDILSQLQEYGKVPSNFSCYIETTDMKYCLFQIIHIEITI